MQEEFIKKIRDQEYISNYFYKIIKENYKYIIPDNFNLKEHNNKVLNNLYEKYKDYFDNMYKDIDNNIHLDEEQIKAILCDEEYSLIIAGAGCGKTTTMASKVKYLVDIKRANPNKIIVMSYTKKATLELQRRINIDFNIPVLVTTFHSLGLMHIREIFKNRKCYVVDENLKNEIFLDYFKNEIFPNKDKIDKILNSFNVNNSNNFILGKHFIKNYSYYNTYEDYFNYYKRCKLSEVFNLEDEINDRIDKRINSEFPLTIKGEIVKSKTEAIIANYLFCNNIEYHYEKVYTDLLDDGRVYRPDFTIEIGGKVIYIEYFGFSNYSNDLNRYNKIKKIKEKYHEKHHNNFIKLDYDKDEDVLKKLELELINYGFRLDKKSNVDIFYALLDSNPLAPIFDLKNFLYKSIELIKSSPDRLKYQEIINNYIDSLRLEERNIATYQFSIIDEFYKYYQRKLFDNLDYGFDYSDMLYYANMYINKVNSNKLNFDYIIIDEYQDISSERYEFTKKIADKNKSKVVAVGDDWQSIFSFAGSRIKYIYNFERYFKGAKLLKINKTYRNSQELINYSGKFIMKNEEQIKKDLVSPKSINMPIRFVLFNELEEYDMLKRTILEINKKHKDHKILILGRTNKIIDRIYLDPDLKDDVDTKITYIGYEDIKIDAMTIHSSKGLTYDEVIIIGLNQYFPSNKNNVFWLEALFKQKDFEYMEYAEERRLFYVALTRTKNYVYLLVNKNIKLRSPFVNELFLMIKDNEFNITKKEV